MRRSVAQDGQQFVRFGALSFMPEHPTLSRATTLRAELARFDVFTTLLPMIAIGNARKSSWTRFARDRSRRVISGREMIRVWQRSCRARLTAFGR